ncbi:MAG: hypothetical protein ACI4PF_06350 [Christensenellales bacterium]
MVGSVMEIKECLETIAKRISTFEEKPNYINCEAYKKLIAERDALYLLLKRHEEMNCG